MTCAPSAAATAAVSSVQLSHTTVIDATGKVWPRSDRIVCAMVAASLWAGISTVIRGSRMTVCSSMRNGTVTAAAIGPVAIFSIRPSATRSSSVTRPGSSSGSPVYMAACSAAMRRRCVSPAS